MAQSALRALTQQLMQGGPAPSGMASYQTAVQNATNRPKNSADMLAGLSQFTSLDTPQNMSLGATAADIGMGFLPGISTAQGIRDFERARRDDDMLGMALGGLSVFPFVGGIVKAGKGIGRAAEGAMDTYYHGGKLTGPINEKEGLFGGIFLSPSERSARSHGGSLYSFDIPPDKIARSGDFMGYSDIPWEDQKAAILRTNKRINSDNPDFDLWYKAVVNDEANDIDEDDLARLFGKEDAGANLWEAQRQRGRLAKELGYDAVNMSDEHGTSVLLVRDRPYSSMGK